MRSILISLAVVCLSLVRVSALPAAETDVRKQADELLARQKYPEAASVYERLAMDPKTDKALAAYALFQVGLCRLKDKRVSEACTAWVQMRTLYPDSPQVPQSLALEAQNITDSFRARTLLEEILTKYPTAPETAVLLRQRGDAAWAANDYAGAAAAWQQFLHNFAKYSDTPNVQQKLAAARELVRVQALPVVE